MDNVERQIRVATALSLGLDPSVIHSDSAFIDDLGADSLDSIELVMAFEELFVIEISDIDAGRITTVADAAEVVRELLALDLMKAAIENHNLCHDCLGGKSPSDYGGLEDAHAMGDMGICGKCGARERVWDLEHLAALVASDEPLYGEGGKVINPRLRNSHLS
ncbi:MAG: phosphopantetheine-binding protein [Roseibium sp.]|uniref:phosphopantetheine-binding protein n=1 Tax=Roseibium sp. TaxID=1936156 RepID=UPI003296A18A